MCVQFIWKRDRQRVCVREEKTQRERGSDRGAKERRWRGVMVSRQESDYRAQALILSDPCGRRTQHPSMLSSLSLSFLMSLLPHHFLPCNIFPCHSSSLSCPSLLLSLSCPSLLPLFFSLSCPSLLLLSLLPFSDPPLNSIQFNSKVFYRHDRKEACIARAVIQSK